MEQTLVEGENYDAYVSRTLIAPLTPFFKKLIESMRSLVENRFLLLTYATF